VRSAAITLYREARAQGEGRSHVEIRHDGMILDGKDVFWAHRIGRNLPQLQNKGDDPNRMVIAGI
jgi:hypothetical protein